MQLLFGLYEELGCLRALTEAAAARGLVSRPRTLSTGKTVGGTAFRRGQLYYLLTNPVYIGRVRHRGEHHEGRHEAIVTEDQWHRVQAMLADRSGRKRDGGTPLSESAPLLGLLRDETGDRLTPTHTRRRGRRYRYYVSHRLVTGPPDPTGWRLRADDLEQGLAGSIRAHLRHAIDRHGLLREPDLTRTSRLRQALDAASGIEAADDAAVAGLLALIAEGILSRDVVQLRLDAHRTAVLLGLFADNLDPAVLDLRLPRGLRRRRTGMTVIVGPMIRQPDAAIVSALARAHRHAAELRAGVDVATLARADHISQSLLRTRLQLAFLAPDMQRAILTGTQPDGLTLGRLTRPEIPLDWDEQRRRFATTA